MKALFCGSFNPITNGHVDVIGRASKLCHHLYVAVMNNPYKRYAISHQCRTELVQEALTQFSNVTVVMYGGLVADFCTEYGIDYIIKGGRNALDLQYEMDMARFNKQLAGVETVYLAAEEQFASLSSSYVRELASYGKEISSYVPQQLADKIVKLLKG